VASFSNKLFQAPGLRSLKYIIIIITIITIIITSTSTSTCTSTSTSSTSTGSNSSTSTSTNTAAPAPAPAGKQAAESGILLPCRFVYFSLVFFRLTWSLALCAALSPEFALSRTA